MPARRCLAALTGAALLCGCGAAQGPDYTLETPPPPVGARPLETPAPERRPSRRDARRLAPVLQGWAAAVRAGDAERAARYFAVPAIVAQSKTVELRTREQVRAFNQDLPCGARLVAVRNDGRYVVGTFRLTDRAGRTCPDAGELARVAFVFRARHFTEWRQMPDRPGAPPGPAAPEPPPAPSALEPV